MEISGKILREVEFRDRLRGYDTDEVDEFLEKVAVGIDELRAELANLRTQKNSPERPVEQEREPGIDDESIRRTLVLAQRTADLAISEAHEEASHLVEDARNQAETLVSQAQDSPRRLRDEAEFEAHERVDRLSEQRERLERDIQSLANLLGTERDRLTHALQSALGFVTESLSFSDDMSQVVSALSSHREITPEPPRSDHKAEEPRNVESEVSEDAARAMGGDTGPVARLNDESRSREPSDVLDPDEALWARWATGADVDLAGESPTDASDTRQFPFDSRGGNYSA